MIIHNKKIKRKKVLTTFTPTTKARRDRFIAHIKSLDGNTNETSMFDANAFICSSCRRSISDHPTLVIGTFSTRPYHGDMCPFLFVDKH